MARLRSFGETEVLEAVRDQFRSTGYAGTGSDRVLAATDLEKSGIYGAFGDRHRLFRGCSTSTAPLGAFPRSGPG